MAVQWLPPQQFKYLREHPQDVRTALINDSQHDQSRVLFRRIVVDVAEVKVERNHGTLLSTAHVTDVSVAVTTKSFVMDRVCIVSLGTKRYRDILM
jgi:hypothetical protein